MPLPSSGAISLGQVNTELGVSATATRSLGDTTTRNLFGVASGAISMSQGYGKANAFGFTISANQTNANLRTLAVNAGWNQSSKVVATINAGVYVSSNSTGTPALTVNGSFPGGVELVNNGFIVGMGGNGGKAANSGTVGLPGGPALSASVPVTIRNAGTIAGGGGGGGGGGAVSFYAIGGEGEVIGADHYHGSGGGGGRSSAAANSSGGGQGTAIGGSGYTANNYYASAGNAGSVSTAGAAGGRTSSYSGLGGGGGGWGAAGESGSRGTSGGFGDTTGGSGGAAVSGNGNITWLATGTRLGAIA